MKPFSKDKKEVNGQWTQEVFRWMIVPDILDHHPGCMLTEKVIGKILLTLPRREYTKRDDYDIMIRGNRHEIVSDGWILIKTTRR